MTLKIDAKFEEKLTCGLENDLFIQSRKCMSLKFTEELCVMTMKNYAKFGKELTCRVKIDITNLTNIDPIKNLHFNGLFLTNDV